MHLVRHRHAGRDRLGDDFAERDCAVARQFAKAAITQLVAEPFANLAAGTDHLELGVRAALDQQQMIAKTTEAAQHDIFVLRQLLAGLQ